MSDAIHHLRDFQISPLGYWWLLACAVILGGAVGSFLNVVAYRLPLGMSLNHPGSRCPKCQRPIRWYHNLPVLGWLILRGRCRDCSAPISPRYPLVELFAALASGLVYCSLVEPVLEGEVPAYSVDVLALLLQLALVYLLLCCALLELDDQRLPLRLALLVVVLWGTFALLWPELLLSRSNAADPGSSLAFAATAAGVLGLLSWPLALLPPAGKPASAVARLASIGMLALVLGGLAVLLIVPLASLLMLGVVSARGVWPPGRRLGWSCALLAATLVWFLLALPAIDLTGQRMFARLMDSSSAYRLLVSVGGVTAVLVLAVRGLVGWLVPDSAKRRETTWPN